MKTFIISGSITIAISLAIFIFLAYKSMVRDESGSIIVKVAECVESPPGYFCNVVEAEDGTIVSDYFPKDDPQTYVGKPMVTRKSSEYNIYIWIVVLVLFIAGLIQLLYGVFKKPPDTIATGGRRKFRGS